ncbi:unnamed protein product [Ilex paraguariensis]|uniref:Uncharacterized protein n=1 Tax=Ilex paraguariensis TaxID=185542 RepID=A0ABC8R8L9_9AQUA
MVTTILAVPLSASEHEDKATWEASTSGHYSVKSKYHLAVKLSDSQRAHMVAHLTKCESLPVDWFLNPPFHALPQIQKDVRVGIG